MGSSGCDVCRGWDGKLSSERSGRTSDCPTSFRAVASYFHAAIRTCPSCGTCWLEGYYEDFGDRPIEAEWGDRHWILRPLTEAQVDQIEASRGMYVLDIDTFAT